MIITKMQHRILLWHQEMWNKLELEHCEKPLVFVFGCTIRVSSLVFVPYLWKVLVTKDILGVLQHHFSLASILLVLRKPFSSLNTPSGSCPASDVQVSLQCNGNVGLVHWTAAKNAESYIAMATGTDGHTHTCTSSGTNCTFRDLHCGEDYIVTVATVERGCQSRPSTPVNLKSGQETQHKVL